MWMIRRIRAELLIADAYPGDWYRWTGGQAGHAAIIGYPLALIAMALGCPPTAAPALVAAVYFWGWEIAIQRGRDWRDSSADAWHVACGAGIAAAPMIALDPASTGMAIAAAALVWIVWMASIVDGIRRRIVKSERP